jgi:hypothetical protein
MHAKLELFGNFSGSKKCRPRNVFAMRYLAWCDSLVPSGRPSKKVEYMAGWLSWRYVLGRQIKKVTCFQWTRSHILWFLSGLAAAGITSILICSSANTVLEIILNVMELLNVYRVLMSVSLFGQGKDIWDHRYSLINWACLRFNLFHSTKWWNWWATTRKTSEDHLLVDCSGWLLQWGEC